MERRIKDYEKYIEKAAKHPTAELRKYHAEMLRNFQHERAMHLAVMLFFVGVTLIFISLTIWGSIYIGDIFTIIIFIITVLLFITSACYIRHYYFLENHIQKLYDTTTKLYKDHK